MNGQKGEVEKAVMNARVHGPTFGPVMHVEDQSDPFTFAANKSNESKQQRIDKEFKP